jgi:transposase
VCVQHIGPDGEPVGDEFAHALWGVESCGDYWREVAAELAGEMLPDERAQECALTEEGA